MSDQTTYQIGKGLPGWERADDAFFQQLIGHEYLVPVVPCKHGNTGRHIVMESITVSDNKVVEWNWCTGVGEETP